MASATRTAPTTSITMPVSSAPPTGLPGPLVCCPILALDEDTLRLVLSRLGAAELARLARCCRALRDWAEPCAAQAVAALAARYSGRVKGPERRRGESCLQFMWVWEQHCGAPHGCGSGRAAAGGGHTIVIGHAGRLFTCGRGGVGQLGVGETHDNGFEEYELQLCHVPVVQRVERAWTPAPPFTQVRTYGTDLSHPQLLL